MARHAGPQRIGLRSATSTHRVPRQALPYHRPRTVIWKHRALASLAARSMVGVAASRASTPHEPRRKRSPRASRPHRSSPLASTWTEVAAAATTAQRGRRRQSPGAQRARRRGRRCHSVWRRLRLGAGCRLLAHRRFQKSNNFSTPVSDLSKPEVDQSKKISRPLRYASNEMYVPF